MISRILVPLDGSPSAEAVLDFVTRIASANQAEVLLVSAVTPIAAWDEVHAAVKWEAEEDSAGGYLGAKRDELAKVGLSVRSRVVFGAAAEVILRIAEDEHADLIGMTTHGRSGVARWVLGSVATKVLHATHTPLLLVRPPASGEQNASTFKKLLVPLDGSELSTSVLPFAGDLAKRLEASLVLFHVVSEPVMTYPGAETLFDTTALEQMQAGAREFLASAAADLTARGVKADVSTAIGNATDGIVWAAERGNADLIVMSTHGRSGVGRMVLGSVADGVVRRTSLPLIVVRPAANSGDARSRNAD